MKKRLYQALISLQTQACNKCTFFFVVSFLILCFVNSASATTLSPTQGDEKTILVSGSVTLAPEFVFALQKNSTLLTEKYAYDIGENITVQVKIIGGNREALKQHSVKLQLMYGENREEIMSGKTDMHGEITFLFGAKESFIGSVRIEATDETYTTPIALTQHISCVVYRAEDAKKQGKKAIKSDMSVNHSVVLGEGSYSEQAQNQKKNIFQNSDTIQIVETKFSFPRAGPVNKI